MSISSLSNDIERLNKDIVSLNQKLARESKNEADKYSRIQNIKKSINKNTSPSSLNSKMRQIAQYEKEISQSKDKQAGFQKDIAAKTKTLSEKRNSLTKEQTKESNKQQEALKKAQKNYEDFTSAWQRKQKKQTNTIISNSQGGVYEATSDVKYDVFISHACEDKETFVNELVKELEKRNIKVWYDQNDIKWGDSIRNKIDEGLRNSRFGIIVISKTYLKKYWTNYEFDALLNKESGGGKIVLPIWYEVTKQDVTQYCPTLAGRMALNTMSYTTEEIAEELKKLLIDK